MSNNIKTQSSPQLNRPDERSSRHERIDDRYESRDRERDRDLRYDQRDPRYMDPRYQGRDAGV